MGRSEPIETPRVRWIAASWAAFAAALAFYYLSVLRIDPFQTDLLDLDPRPDAVEYFAIAESLVSDGTVSIRIANDRLPSRYPAGFPVLMLPWLAVLPADRAIAAPFLTNHVIGLLLILVTFGFFYATGRRIAAGVLALLLATLPVFTTLARSPMSDLSGVALVVWAFMFISVGMTWQRRWPIYCGAALLGLAVNIRLQAAFFAPALLAMALVERRDSWRTWTAHNALCIALLIACASPTLLNNFWTFGHPLRTGYEFWVPGTGGAAGTFSLEHLSGNLMLLWNEFTLAPEEFGVANLFGTGAHFTPPFIALAVIGLASVEWGRLAICTGLAVAVFLAAALTYFYLDLRLYAPLLILSLLVMAQPIEQMAARTRSGGSSTVHVVVAGLCILSIVGVPSVRGDAPVRYSVHSLDAVAWAGRKGVSVNYALTQYVKERLGSAPGLLLTDLSPVYVAALLPRGFITAPVDEEHDYVFSAHWRYGRSHALALVQQGLKMQMPVYAATPLEEPAVSFARRLPSLPDATWEIVNTPADAQGTLYRLVPDVAP